MNEVGELGAARIFDGPGEMRALCRAMDWSATPLGPVEGWPLSLRTIVATMLGSRHPMFLFWGPELVQIYNDAYRPSLGEGGRHPRALGMRGREFWTDIWDTIGPQIEQVMTGGAATWHEDQYLPILRNGRLEDVWWTYSYSPVIGDDGEIAATLVVCQETTQRVLSERRMLALNRELAVERERLSFVFREAPSFLAVLRGPEHRFVLANEAYHQLVGRRELVGRSLRDALPEVEPQGFSRILDRVVETGEPYVGHEVAVMLARTPGGEPEERFVDFVYQPLVDADGTRSGVVAHGSDVTDHVRARRSLERVAERMRQLQALTSALAAATTTDDVSEVVVSQGMAATGAATGLLAVRRSGAARATVLRHEGLGAEALSGYRPGFTIDAPGPAAECLRTGQPVFEETRASLTARFSEIPHVWDALGTHALATVPLTVGEDTVGTISFTFTKPRAFAPEDREFFLSLAQQASQALERARLYAAEEAALRRATALQRVTSALAGALTPEQVADAVMAQGVRAMDAQAGTILRVSESGTHVELLRFVGYPGDSMERWSRFPISKRLPLTEAVRTREPVFLESVDEWRARFDDFGPLRVLESSRAWAALPLAVEGRVLGGMGLSFAQARSFTEEDRAFMIALAQQCGQALERGRLFEAERAARAEAEAANRAKGEFLAVMSHELRTPLNAIGGYAELMAMGIRGPVTERQRDDLERIQRSQKHLLGLINEVLNYARLETGTVRYEVSEVRVASAVAAVESLILPQVHQKSITLSTSACDPTLAMRADPEKVQQILVNLLSNAAKFTESGGRIDIECRSIEGGRVALVVRDTGVGIPSDKLEAVFEPFVQIGRALNSPGEGTGLGLSISRDLARGMGGDLTVESAVGVGSAFSLVLPEVTRD